MRSFQKSGRFISFVVLYSLMTVFAFGAGAVTAPPATSGILEFSGSGSVLVNGNVAKDGATVLPDARIQTQNGAEATVNFASYGRLHVGCDSSVTTGSRTGTLEAKVGEGFAQLTTNKGVSGTLVMPDGQVLNTDPATVSSIHTLNGNPCAADPSTPPQTSGSSHGLNGVLAAVIIGGAIAVAFLATRDNEKVVVSPAR